MCVSMVDIQSATAEIRRGKKEETRRKKPHGQKYNGLLYSVGQAIMQNLSRYDVLHFRILHFHVLCFQRPLRYTSCESPRLAGEEIGNDAGVFYQAQR